MEMGMFDLSEFSKEELRDAAIAVIKIDWQNPTAVPNEAEIEDHLGDDSMCCTETALIIQCRLTRLQKQMELILNQKVKV